MTVVVVSLLISKSSNNKYEIDPIPTWLAKELIDVLASTISKNFLTHTNTQLYVPELRSRRLIRMTYNLTDPSKI